MKTAALLFILFLPGGTGSTADRGQPSWKEVNRGDGIVSFSRIVEDGSTYEFQALTIVDAPMEVLAEILRDVLNYNAWMAYYHSTEILQQFDKNNFILHIVLDFPVISSRDMVVRADTVYDLTRAGGTITLTMLKDHPLPVPTGMVRVREFRGIYHLESITRYRTGVRFYYRADPGGHIPDFVVNMVMRRLLYDTLWNLKNRVSRDNKYILSARDSSDRRLFDGIYADRERMRRIFIKRISDCFGDHRSIELLMSHDTAMDRLLDGRSTQLTEKLFFYQGSRKARAEIAGGAIELMAQVITGKDGPYRKPAEDPALINRFIDGPGRGESCVYDIIRERTGGAGR